MVKITKEIILIYVIHSDNDYKSASTLLYFMCLNKNMLEAKTIKYNKIIVILINFFSRCISIVKKSYLMYHLR